jgi:hypothetical protein
VIKPSDTLGMKMQRSFFPLFPRKDPGRWVIAYQSKRPWL